MFQFGTITFEQSRRSQELFAREVMPEFHDLEPVHAEWKAEVLAGDRQLDEIDTEPYTPIGP